MVYFYSNLQFGKAPSCLCNVPAVVEEYMPSQPAEYRRDVTPEKHCPTHLEACSLLIHLINGSGRKALCVLMTE